MRTDTSALRQAVLLSAGFGTRLGPLTEAVPKAMLPIGGKVLLEHHIERLKASGINELFINLHYRGESIRKHFDDGGKWRVRIQYSQEPFLLGTAGALRPFRSALSDRFFVICADVFSLLNYSEMGAAFLATGATGMALVGHNDHPEDSDLVKIGRDNQIEEVVFRPHKALDGVYKCLQGIYVFDKRIIDYIPVDKPYALECDLLPVLLNGGEAIHSYESTEFVQDVGTLKRYSAVEKSVSEK